MVTNRDSICDSQYIDVTENSLSGDALRRYKLALACNDSEFIPKVENAGQVILDADTSRPIQIMHNGLKVYCDSHYGLFNVAIIKALKGHHEPQEEKAFYEVLKFLPDKAIMVELGALWGYYSMWFNKEITLPTNYLVEPMGLLNGVENFKLNGLTNAHFIEACVGRESKETVQFKHWDGTVHERQQVCIDDFIENQAFNYIDLLHSDIQGFEVEMLLGAKKCLSENKIGFLFISTHGMDLHFQCLEILSANNYVILAECSPRKSFTEDGVIVAKANNVSFGKLELSKRPGAKMKDAMDFMRYKLSHMLGK